MSKDDWIYVGHMLDMSRRAVHSLQGKSRKAYDQDYVLVMALAHFIQMIGEAARKVSPGFQELHPNIPWRQVIGMRHRIVHDYMNVDEEVIWEVVTHDLSPLIADLETIIGSGG